MILSMFRVTEASLIRTPASKGGVDHYLVRLTLAHPYGHSFYQVFEKTGDGIRWYETYVNDPAWQVLSTITDWRILPVVVDRLKTAQAWSQYDLILSNCEHFARYVIEGTDRSTQVVAGAVVAVAAIAFGLAIRE